MTTSTIEKTYADVMKYISNDNRVKAVNRAPIRMVVDYNLSNSKRLAYRNKAVIEHDNFQEACANH